MSITKTLSDKKIESSEKLSRVAEIVAQARANYGNEGVEISSPSVGTANGYMSFVHLDDDSKVVMLQGEVAKLKASAVEYAEQNEGVDLNRKIEELLATNGMFVNIAAGTKFEYI